MSSLVTWNKNPGAQFQVQHPVRVNASDCFARPGRLLTGASRPEGKITPTFRYALADDPSTTVVGLLVEYPPNGSTPPHRHGTASVIAYVIEGEVLSAMNDEEAKSYGKGGSFYEAPGCHHRISDNNSQTEKAIFHATFVIKTEILEKEGLGVLVQIDPEYLE